VLDVFLTSRLQKYKVYLILQKTNIEIYENPISFLFFINEFKFRNCSAKGLFDYFISRI